VSRASSSSQRWIALSAIVAFLIGFAWLLLAPAAADAQDSTAPTISLSASPVDAAVPFRTIAVEFDPGTAGVGSLSANLNFDPTQVAVQSCDISEVGACSVQDGFVRFATFSLGGGIQANSQLVTVNFVAVGTDAETEFVIEVDVADSAFGQNLPEPIASSSVVVELTAPSVGSLTGTVTELGNPAGFFGADVCVTNNATLNEQCGRTSGLGTWRFDALVVGDYTITVVDPSGVLATNVSHAVVRADQITAGLVAELSAVIEEPLEADTVEEDTASVAGPQTSPAPVRQPNTPLADINYSASISGQVVDAATGQPVSGISVCATQPLVLHQSCSLTNANGSYVLDNLSTGNYWVVATDSLARFDSSDQTLVGVVGEIVRDGVRILMTAN